MPGVLEKLNILFICTGNTCRSQMAEGLLRIKAGDRMDVRSAGSDPGRRVNPFAIQVMNEIGIDISGQHPKNVNEFYEGNTIHYVITVCDSAAKRCPVVWNAALNRLHWPFEDPYEFMGDTEEGTIAKYREVRDLISARIDEWLADPHGHLGAYRK